MPYCKNFHWQKYEKTFNFNFYVTSLLKISTVSRQTTIPSCFLVCCCCCNISTGGKKIKSPPNSSPLQFYNRSDNNSFFFGAHLAKHTKQLRGSKHGIRNLARFLLSTPWAITTARKKLRQHNIKWTGGRYCLGYDDRYDHFDNDFCVNLDGQWRLTVTVGVIRMKINIFHAN